MTAEQPRTAIVTGASRGIGLGIAAALVNQGHRVCITGRNVEALAEAAARMGDRAIYVAGKAHDSAHQDQVVKTVLETFGSIDYLVNNVGTNPVFAPVMDLEVDLVRKILDINVVSHFSWTQRVYRAWMAGHGGSIVNVSSIAALHPSPGLGIYGMSKAALSYLTAELAVELGPRVRVNAVAPGVVKTKFAEALYVGREDEAASAYPAGRLGVPEDVAEMVVFLLSDKASWITGQTVVIDGGVNLVGRG